MNSQTPSSINNDMGPGEVGDLLRASRIRHGQELADVAHALRIRIVYLQAIEDSRYENLPGAVYALGFIRSYAEHLGLDGEQLVSRFKSDSSGQGRKPILTFPTIVPENGIPRGAIVAFGGLILLLAYGSWYFLSSQNLYVTDLIPPVPESIARALEAGRAGVASVGEMTRGESSSASSAAAATQSSTQKSSEVAPLSPMAAPASVAISPSTPLVPAAPRPAARPAPAATADASEPVSEDDEDEVERTPPPTAAGPQAALNSPASVAPTITSGAAMAPEAPPVSLDDRGGVDAPAVGSQLANLPGLAVDPEREIVLTATIDSWIQIRDTVENKLVLTRLLRKGEKYTVPSREGLTLVTGNAGGLEITVGGDATPTLGPLGVVRRNVVLDPLRLRAGNAIIE